MGSSPSKKSSTISQKDKYQQSLSPQNNTNRSQSRSVTPASTGQSFTSIRLAQQPTMNDSDPLLHQNPLSSRPKGSSASSSSNKTNLSRNTEHPSSHQDNDNDHNRGQPSRTNHLRKSSGSASSPDTTRLTQVRTSLTYPNTQSKRRTSEDERSTPIITGLNGRCSHCPHCNRLPQTTVKNSPIQAPPWIVEAPRTDQRHIIMDNYDEVAIRKKRIAEHGHVPGCYDYSPNLTIEEEKNDRTSNKYSTLPLVSKSGSPTTPSHTPFPNYDALQRREKRLNQPYTTTLFTD